MENYNVTSNQQMYYLLGFSDIHVKFIIEGYSQKENHKKQEYDHTTLYKEHHDRNNDKSKENYTFAWVVYNKVICEGHEHLIFSQKSQEHFSSYKSCNEDFKYESDFEKFNIENEYELFIELSL
jgi:hypothetical protein